jgi:hypothetical protein
VTGSLSAEVCGGALSATPALRIHEDPGTGERVLPPTLLRAANVPAMATKKKAGAVPPEKVWKAGIARDATKYLYYVDKQCNVVRMERGVAKAKTEVIVVTGLKREKGFDYFLDDDGDVAREPE